MWQHTGITFTGYIRFRYFVILQWKIILLSYILKEKFVPVLNQSLGEYELSVDA